MKALVIGGTGPTGPHVVQGLLDRDYEVTLFHRGVHEPDDLPVVEHIHGDPHFAETIEEALAGRDFDVVMAMYGRVKVIGDVLAGRCRQLVCVGGIPVYENCLEPGRFRPFGMRVAATEDTPLADHQGEAPKMARLMLEAERSIFAQAASGAYQATFVRYPSIYGPRNTVPWEWSVIKRVQDGRTRMILPDNGMGIVSRCAAANAAGVLLKVVDNPAVADGEAYNCADDVQFTFRQWVEVIVDVLGGSLEVFGLPAELAGATWAELIPMRDLAPHGMVDATKAKVQLGYTEVLGAHEALAETVRWFLDHPVDRAQYAAYADAFDYEAEDRLMDAYARAVAQVRDEAGRDVPELFHALPHPKTPGTGVDERGR